MVESYEFSHIGGGGCTQVGVVKRYSGRDPVEGLLNLVRLDQGLEPDVEFMNVSTSGSNR